MKDRSSRLRNFNFFSPFSICLFTKLRIRVGLFPAVISKLFHYEESRYNNLSIKSFYDVAFTVIQHFPGDNTEAASAWGSLDGYHRKASGCHCRGEDL
jgi:hypothetical protein